MKQFFALLSTKTAKAGIVSILSGAAMWISFPERQGEAIQLIVTGVIAITMRDAIAKGQK